jgi:hypothetical protein
MTQKPTFWNADKIVSFSAILISLATMGVYIYQTHLIQKQQHASVMPYLTIGYSHHNENHFSVEIVNNGLGPALVEEVSVYYEGKKYKNCDLGVFFYNYNPQKDSLNFSNSSMMSGMLIPAGKTIINIEAYNKNGSEKMQGYFWNEEPLKLEINYSSIYGERWQTKGGFTRPKKLED